MIRSFIGLPLPQDAIRRIVGLQRPIAGARIVPEENLHLTLAFLGDQPEAQLRHLAHELDALNKAPIPITLNAPDLLGGKHPQGIALAAEASDPLKSLHGRIERLLTELDFDFTRRKFRPHVTLYRLPNTVPPDTQAAIQSWLGLRAGMEPIVYTADALWLYSSRLTSEGPVYTALAELPLGPA